MAFVDQFALSNGTAGTTQARTGYGFQPAALLVIAAGNALTSGSSLYNYSIGLCVTESDRCCTGYVFANGSSGSGGSASKRSTDCIARGMNTSPADLWRWDIDSIDSDGVTFIVDADGFGTNMVATVIAFSSEELPGGADILSWTVPAGTGSSSITGASIESPNTAIHVGAQTDGGSGKPICFGASAGDTPSNACTAIKLRNATGTTFSINYSNDTECMAQCDSSASTGITDRVRVTGWESDGFTINTDEAGGSMNVYSLVMRASYSALGSLTTLTSTGVDIDSDTSGTANLRGIIFSSHCEAESSSDTGEETTSAEISIGLCDQDLNQSDAALRGRDAVEPTESFYDTEADSVYLNINATSDVLEGEMAVTSIGPRTAFTCQMTDADPSGTFVWFMVIGVDTAPRGAPIFF